MKQSFTTEVYYREKAGLLSSLIGNLEQAKRVMSYGDSDTAVHLEDQNEQLLLRLQELDNRFLEIPDNWIAKEETILQADQVFQLLDQARGLQKEVEALLHQAVREAKAEYLQVKIQRQLRRQLSQSPLSWTKNYC